MKSSNGLRIETIVSFIINIILGALVFAWACANMPTAATAVGIMVLAIGLAFTLAFPKLISSRN